MSEKHSEQSLLEGRSQVEILDVGLIKIAFRIEVHAASDSTVAAAYREV